MPSGRIRTFDRDAALDVAMKLFWKKGFSATSVADLCSAMGIASPSMYAAFGNKEALYEEALNRYSETRASGMWQEFRNAATIREAVLALLLRGIKTFTHPTEPFGCMGTVLSIDESESPQLSRLMKECRSQSFRALRDGMQAAQLAGQLPEQTDVDALARVYLSVLQGISIQARDGVPPDILEHMVVHFMQGWDALAASLAVANKNGAGIV